MKTDSIPLVEPTAAALAELTEALRATLPIGRIEVQSLPGCDSLKLGLINADFPTGPLPADIVHAVIARPAYWSLCWGSGLGLARLLYRHPQWVRDAHVLDFGSGSGVAGIAAALNGAARVVACDNDPDARRATRANALLNGVRVQVSSALGEVDACDVALVADVLYDRDNAALLDALERVSRTVIVADSRIVDAPAAAYRPVTEIDARTLPNLNEFDEYRTVRVWVYGPLPGF